MLFSPNSPADYNPSNIPVRLFPCQKVEKPPAQESSSGVVIIYIPYKYIHEIYIYICIYIYMHYMHTIYTHIYKEYLSIF